MTCEPHRGEPRPHSIQIWWSPLALTNHANLLEVPLVNQIHPMHSQAPLHAFQSYVPIPRLVWIGDWRVMSLHLFQRLLPAPWRTNHPTHDVGHFSHHELHSTLIQDHASCPSLHLSMHEHQQPLFLNDLSLVLVKFEYVQVVRFSF
ncbi:MAG: Uncharacterised protein [Marine Group II euryarchaeote MED-G33]|nr:MAG: Uncharacterised protein [Marine Group II euryarchaeote MED-G33]